MRVVAAGLTLLLAAAAPGAAESKKKPVPRKCTGVVAHDEPGDPSSLDIRYVNLATSKHSVVVVLGLDTTDEKADPETALGAEWLVRLTVDRSVYEFARRRSPGPTAQYTYEARRPDGVRASHAGRTTATEIQWRATRRDLLLMAVPSACEVTALTKVAVVTADSAP